MIKGDKFFIDGRVCYDWAEKDSKEKKKVIFELWWDEECYCLLYRPVEMMNMLSVLMGRLKLEPEKHGYRSVHSQIKHTDEVLPFNV